jgi:hypothetical protein
MSEDARYGPSYGGKSRGLIGIVRAGGRTLQDREIQDIMPSPRHRTAIAFILNC